MTHAVIDIFENSIRTYCRTKADGVVRVAQTIHNKFHVICHLNDALNTCARLNPARRWGGSSVPSRARSSCCSSAGLGCEAKAREALDAILAATVPSAQGTPPQGELGLFVGLH